MGDKTSLILANAKLKILEAESQPPKDKKQEYKSDILLIRAMDEVSNAVSHIEEEEASIRKAIKRTQENKADKYWQTRVAYLENQIEVIREQYPIYQDIARQRRERYFDIQRTQRWGREKELCREDTHHWFKYWAWTSDPRTTGFGWALPFIPYEFQQEAIDWLEDHIFVTKSSCGIEKSRDLGFSWLILSMFYKHWQHGDGTFQALMGSMTIDDVDTVGNPSSLFEKLRIQSQFQPDGLIPSGWDRQIPYLKCINPETGASIVGESCNPRFGRSGRYKVILLDELSAVEQDTSALTACSQSSPCKIYNSTVRGMGNEFALIRHSGNVPFKTYHWTQHPYKDERWYEFQKVEMRDETRVAQELDIDYTASTPNRVYKDYNEVMHVVTKSEVMRALPTFRADGNMFRIPLGHSVVMGEDVSMADGCAHALLWFCTLREDTKTVDGIDLSGSILIYRQAIMPPESTPRKTAKTLKELELPLERRMMNRRLISHEAITERVIYEEEYNLIFEHWDTDYNGGIARVRDYLEIQFKDEIHPFREWSRATKFPNSPPIKGRPLIFIVSDDDQAELVWDAKMERYNVTPSRDDGGCSRLRKEFPVYHFANVELGKEVTKRRPKKIFDDCMDVVRCVANVCFAPVQSLSIMERSIKALPEGLTTARIAEMSPAKMQVAYLQQQQHIKEFVEREKNKLLSWRDQTFLKSTR